MPSLVGLVAVQGVGAFPNLALRRISYVRMGHTPITFTREGDDIGTYMRHNPGDP